MNKFKTKYLPGVELGSEKWHLGHSIFNWDIMDLVEALKENDKIKSLDLAGNEIGVEEVKELAAALRENKNIKLTELLSSC